jgi:hypothetical protein
MFYSYDTPGLYIRNSFQHCLFETVSSIMLRCQRKKNNVMELLLHKGGICDQALQFIAPVYVVRVGSCRVQITSDNPTSAEESGDLLD